jgi:cysteine-rich repeat protein
MPRSLLVILIMALSSLSLAAVIDIGNSSAFNTQSQECGDSILQRNEQCDDGGQLNGDGCTSSCRVEWGYFECGVGSPDSCGEICGDGVKITAEACDDGNILNGDGCSAECKIETPLTFDCALENDQKQRDAFPNYISPRANGERSFTSGRQSFDTNFEPILEQVPHCNGLPWALDAFNRHLIEYQFIVVLDKSWVDYFDQYQGHFLTQGYESLEDSPKILFDRASYLFEAQFGVRVGISRVVVLDMLEQKCQVTGGYVDDGVADNTNTYTALAEKNIVKSPAEMGVVRLGIDPPDTYCASYSYVAPWQNELPILVNTENPFSGDSGLLRHRAAVTLAHELAHFFGIMVTSAHPHHLNGHVANEIPDIMVWNGIPVEAVRPDGMFFKFLTACTPVYDEYLCAGVKATASSSIATPLICLGDSECLIDTDADGSPDECLEPSLICVADAFPTDPTESIDTDGDSIGNNTDTDDDNDGIFDRDDAFPLDPTESSDADMDGTGDNNDAFPNNSLYAMDSDSDGMPDAWETKYGLDPNDPNDAASDKNNDSVTALDEFLTGAVPTGVLDLDGDGQYDALTDGLLLLRDMFGLDGSALVTGTIAADAAYTESFDIESRIATLGDLADIDGNGTVDALTDGLLTLRYLFGLQGDTLINGVVAGDATRTTAEEIEAHLETLMPGL